MHELIVTESALTLALQHADDAGASQVTDIYLVIGQLSSIVDDSVQFYWDLIAEGTLCEGARLHFERIPARFLCVDCGAEIPFEGELRVCHQCNSANLRLLQGDEFRLDQIAIEKDELAVAS